MLKQLKLGFPGRLSGFYETYSWKHSTRNLQLLPAVTNIQRAASPRYGWANQRRLCSYIATSQPLIGLLCVSKLELNSISILYICIICIHPSLCFRESNRLTRVIINAETLVDAEMSRVSCVRFSHRPVGGVVCTVCIRSVTAPLSRAQTLSDFQLKNKNNYRK